MAQGIVVDTLPIAFHEGRNEQEQRAAGLMEIRYHAAHNVESVARSDDNACGGMEHRQPVAIHVGKNGVEGLACGRLHAWLGGQFVGHPLRHAQFVGRQLGIALHHYSYII